MLRATSGDSIIRDQVVSNEDNSFDGVNNSEVDETKVGAKTAQFKSQN